MNVDKRLSNVEELMKAMSNLLEQHASEIQSLKRAFSYYDKALSQCHEEVRLCNRILREQATKR